METRNLKIRNEKREKKIRKLKDGESKFEWENESIRPSNHSKAILAEDQKKEKTINTKEKM